VSQDVYRASKLPEPVEAPPSELVYVATDHEKKGAHFAWMQLFVLPAILGAVVAVFHAWLGLFVMLGAIVYSYRRRKKSVTRAGAVLEVREGELRVYARDGVAPSSVIKLRDLADVRLDVKTIERVQEGNSMIPAVRFTNTTVGPAVDQARIVLVGRKTKSSPDRVRVHLTDEYFAHMDSTEWLGKIRVFLRKHGWLPVDERKKEKPAS
jgi:hypothetical protein